MSKSKNEGVSFGPGDSISYGDSASVGGISRESRKRREMARLNRRRTENPTTRKLLFRPKVYDAWREGDLDFETAERERILKDIAAKEARLMEKRKKRMEDGGPVSRSDSSDENQVVSELEKLKSRRQREEEFKNKLEEDKKKQHDDEMMEMEEKLASELQNPSVYGWFYTDGYYDNAPYLGLREDLVEKINAQQQSWIDKWNQKYPESFTAMFKRFFWPPKYICGGKTFRTRGSYLDFPEVIADWPKGVEVNFEREPREYITNRHELFGVDEEQKKKDEEALEEALAEEGIVMESEPPPEPQRKSSKKRKHNKVAPGDNKSRRSKGKKKKDKAVEPVSSTASTTRSRRKYLYIKHDPSWKVNTYKDLPD